MSLIINHSIFSQDQHNAKNIAIEKLNDKGQYSSVTISDLKVGDKIKINEKSGALAGIMMPFELVSNTDNCDIMNDETEQKQTLKKQERIDKNTRILAGEFTVTSDYHNHNHLHHKLDQVDNYLYIFLALSLFFSLTFAVVCGLMLGSFAVTLHTFATNLMIACPCVFLLVRPLINNNLSSTLKHAGLIVMNLPARLRASFIVFDRTHTLYHPIDDKSEFVIDKKTVNTLRMLKESDYKMFIVSGHGSGECEAHLQSCQESLEGIIDRDNIIFNSQYHLGGGKDKKDIIQKLKKYGQINSVERMGMEKIMLS